MNEIGWINIVGPLAMLCLAAYIYYIVPEEDSEHRRCW